MEGAQIQRKVKQINLFRQRPQRRRQQQHILALAAAPALCCQPHEPHVLITVVVVIATGTDFLPGSPARSARLPVSLALSRSLPLPLCEIVRAHIRPSVRLSVSHAVPLSASRSQPAPWNMLMSV